MLLLWCAFSADIPHVRYCSQWTIIIGWRKATTTDCLPFARSLRDMTEMVICLMHEIRVRFEHFCYFMFLQIYMRWCRNDLPNRASYIVSPWMQGRGALELMKQCCSQQNRNVEIEFKMQTTFVVTVFTICDYFVHEFSLTFDDVNLTMRSNTAHQASIVLKSALEISSIAPDFVNARKTNISDKNAKRLDNWFILKINSMFDVRSSYLVPKTIFKWRIIAYFRWFTVFFNNNWT